MLRPSLLAGERFKRWRKRRRIECGNFSGKRVMLQADFLGLQARKCGSVVCDASTRTIQQNQICLSSRCLVIHLCCARCKSASRTGAGIALQTEETASVA